MKYRCLSIAGFDGSGGAGLQADLKTFSALGCYGMNVLTAIAVQNTQGVIACYDIPLSCIEEQLSAIFDDIVPDAIKIGMLFSAPIISVVGHFLKKRAAGIPIVLDPVMVAKSGDPLLHDEAVEALKEILIPQATLITPNLPEGHRLLNHRIEASVMHHVNSSEKQALAEQLLKLGSGAVLLKGGHDDCPQAIDVLVTQDGEKEFFEAPRINSQNTHGTGCTLSAAITSFLAQKIPLISACAYGKDYLHHALDAAKDSSVGQGRGPVHHFYRWW